jgi:molybdenum cofactor cytidylyltransferase
MKAPPFCLAVVILAAGASRRMGRPKLLLPWGSRTILEHLVLVWRQLGAQQIGVVCSIDRDAEASELDRLGLAEVNRIWNEHPENGMFSSIQAAARWNGWRKDTSHFAIVLGDQPHVGLGTLQSLLAHALRSDARICQPSRNQRARHPVLMDRRSFDELETSAAVSLKDFLESHSNDREWVELEDPALDLDLDSPEDYARALQLHGRPDEPLSFTS